MAHGNNHAKKIVIEEATGLAAKLQNGNAGCAETQGRAIGLLVKMITPLYAADFVTVDECRRQHAGDNTKFSRIRVGPFSIEGCFGPTITLIIFNMAFMAAVFFAVGKTQNWW